MRAKQFLCLITTEYRRVGQDQLSVEFFIVLSTHIWIQVKGKDKICCLKYFEEYAEAYQKAKSLLEFMLCLSDNYQTHIIEAFNSSSRYLDVVLNIYNPYFEQMVGEIYPTELQLNKANSSDTEAPFLKLNLSIANGIVSSKIYDKRDDFNF